MKLVIQRVSQASVSVDKQLIGEIGIGLMVLVGIANSDTEKELEYVASKLMALRIFPDENSVMNLSVSDIKGELLLISQFTLLAKTRKGNRPSYIEAAKPDVAKELYEGFCKLVQEKSTTTVKMGIFGADMQVALVNDGPVTIVIDSNE